MPIIETEGAASSQGFGQFARQVSGPAQAEAIDFDTTNDVLSRSSTLTGSADSKTLTFSAWVYNTENGYDTYVFSTGTSGTANNSFYVNFSANAVEIRAYDASGQFILSSSGSIGSVLNTWAHILVSIDLSDTSKRSVYINDILDTGYSWSTYLNQTIKFTQPNAYVNRLPNATVPAAVRFSNVYLDYTYRDLSVTANRRLFVTADLKPAAGQAGLNPIMYLPMSDPTNPGLNQGTGGNFTLSGVVARSGRGPNQYNAPYSDFDGSADYLSRTTAPTGIFDNSSFTVHCAFVADSVSTAQKIVFFGSDASNRFQVAIDPSGQISLQGYNASGTQLLGVTTVASIVAGRNYVLDVSVELFNPSARHFFINGQAASATWNVYTGGFIDFNIATTPRYHICANTNTGSPSQFFNGRLGALWFDISYIDLSVPANLAKFVTGTGINAAPADLGASGELPTGTSPLIYLPMYGNNAGRNYGTGGNFTVNSGPYTGARGPNEFWGNRADFTASPYLSRSSALTGITNTKQITLSFWAQFDNWGQVILSLADSAGNLNVYVDNASNKIRVFACNASGAVILQAETPATLSTGTAYYIQMCADMTSTTLRAFYINGVSVAATWSYTNDTIAYQQATLPTIGAYWNGSQYTAASRLDGRISELYLSNGFVDFRFEENRLKFRDCFGNPVNLTQQIEAAAIPTPAIYMRFPPTSFGTNSGTGGNFTVNGTITDGGQL